MHRFVGDQAEAADGPVVAAIGGLVGDGHAENRGDAVHLGPLGLFAARPGMDEHVPAERGGGHAGVVLEAAPIAQALLTALEVRAVQTARPTPGSADLIVTATRTGRTVTVVTNNSTVAVTAYLTRQHLGSYVGQIIGRDDPDPDLMKPSPYRVRIAVSTLQAEPEDCVFIGDTVTDVLAGLLGGVAVIGYANKPGKAEALSQAGARAVTTDLTEITTALRHTPLGALPN